jgi:hypothetical protein
MPHVTGRGAAVGVQALFVLVVPLALLPIALKWQPAAWLAAVLLALVAVLPVIGPSNAAIGFMLVTFATIPFNDVHPIGALGWMELSDPFLLVGFALLVPRILGNTLNLPTAFLVGAIGFVTVGTLSALVSDDPVANFRYLWNVVKGLIVLPVLLAWWQPARQIVVAASLAYMLGNCVNTFAALNEGPVPGENRYAGLTLHPNAMGICAVLSIALVPFLLAALPRKYHFIVVTMGAISMYGVWLTGSRAAFAGAVMLVLLYPLLSRSIPAALAVAGLGVTAFAIGSRLAERADPSSLLGRLLGSDSAQRSDTERLKGALDAIHQFLDHPFLGAGWLELWGAHVSYLQVPAAIGVFGLVFYLMLLASLLRPLVTLPEPYRLLAVPALATFMLDVFLPILGALFIWIVVGLVLNADRLDALERRDPDESPPGTPPGLPGAGLARPDMMTGRR